MAASTVENSEIPCENDNFYENAKKYWSTVDPTVNGMLGGYGCISHADINGSRLFLQKIFNSKIDVGKRRALDCGAGIGRVTQNLLSKFFQEVDLVEQDPSFAAEAQKRLSEESYFGQVHIIGLQDFIPPPDRLYNIIWCQWVLGHLTDDHLVEFFKRCQSALMPNGLICIKENICTTSKTSVVDNTDSSVTRPLNVYLDIFAKANLRIVKQSTQSNFPRQLYSVKLFALKPQ